MFVELWSVWILGVVVCESVYVMHAWCKVKYVGVEVLIVRVYVIVGVDLFFWMRLVCEYI